VLAAASPAAAQDARALLIASFVVSIVVNTTAASSCARTSTFRLPRRAPGHLSSESPCITRRDGLDFPLHLSGIGGLRRDERALPDRGDYPGRYVTVKAWVPDAIDRRRRQRRLHVRLGVVKYDDHDELYCERHRNEWNAAIGSSKCSWTAPPERRRRRVQTAAYTGGFARPAAITPSIAPELLAVSARPAPCGARGPTVVVAWRPAAWCRRPSFAEPGGSPDYWPLAFRRSPSVWAHSVWSAFGRDPGAKQSVKPELRAPGDLIPAQAGALVDERAHPRDVIATVATWRCAASRDRAITTAFGGTNSCSSA